jgi:hypothetical protein
MSEATSGTKTAGNSHPHFATLMRATLLRQRDQSAAVALEVYRERIVAVLDTQLKKGDKALIGNSAYRRYLRKSCLEKLPGAIDEWQED